MKTEILENADVTASICFISEHALGSLEITRGQFAFLFSVIEARVSNTSNFIIDLRMSQRFRAHADIF